MSRWKRTFARSLYGLSAPVLILLFATVPLDAAVAAGEHHAEIRGNITVWAKNYRQPAKDVPVVLTDSRGATDVSYTDVKGDYRFLVHAPGTYTLSILYKSYCPVHRPRFSMLGGDSIKFDFDLLLCIFPESFNHTQSTGIVPYQEETITAANGNEALVAYGGKTNGELESHYENMKIPGSPDVQLPVTIRFERYTIQGDSASLDRQTKSLRITGRIYFADGGERLSYEGSCLVLKLEQSNPQPHPCIP